MDVLDRGGEIPNEACKKNITYCKPDWIVLDKLVQTISLIEFSLLQTADRDT